MMKILLATLKTSLESWPIYLNCLGSAICYILTG